MERKSGWNLRSMSKHTGGPRSSVVELAALTRWSRGFESLRGQTRGDIVAYRSSKRVIYVDRNQKVTGQRTPRHLPHTREECIDQPQPCPYVSCRFNLFLDITPDGSIIQNYPGKKVWQIKESLCALDYTERRGMTLKEIGKHFDLTRERIRQVAEIAFRKFLISAYEMGVAEDIIESLQELANQDLTNIELHTLNVDGPSD